MTDPIHSSAQIDQRQDGATSQPRPRKRGRKKLDGRTWQAKLLLSTRKALIAHVGGKPSAVQSVLIDAAAQVTVSISAMDAKREQTGALTLHDGREYLAWQNTLRRTMAALGMKAAPTAPRTLAEVRAGHATQATAA